MPNALHTVDANRNREWAAQLLAGASVSSAEGADDDALAVITNLLDMVQSLRERAEQLEGALQSRIAIEQAKGVLAERLAIDPEAAFVLLRRSARTSRLRLRDLCATVAATRTTPPEIELVMDEIRGAGSHGGEAA